MTRVLARIPSYALLLAVLALCLFPLGWAVLTSLKTHAEVIANPYGLPETPHWENYTSAWEIGRFSRYTLNTLLIAGPTVFLVIALALPIGYAVSRYRLLGRGVIFLLFLLGLMIPIHGFMVPMFQNLMRLGLIDTHAGAVLAMTATSLPFTVYLLRQAIDELPDGLIEAAVIDGARPFTILWYVVLPLVQPTIAALAVLQIISSWNELLIPLITLYQDDLRPISVGLTFFTTRFSVNHSLAAAGTVIASLPLVVAYLVFQRHFVRGLLSGSVKG